MESQALDFDQLMAAMHLDAHERRTVGMIGREAPKLVKRMVAYDPLSLAATFAGLLTVPDLQSNCPRLEMLIHQSLGSAKGRKKADAAIVRTAFDIAGEGRCGRLEDPAEDLFVRNITTKRGNFRIIEGIWESGGFYLQRVVNVVEMMPDVPVFNEIRDSVYALLGVSEMVCERAGLSRYELGETSPHEKFPGELTGMIGSVRNRVCFTQAELKAAGIDHEHLIPFVFDPRQRAHILEDEFINARLERWPLVWNEDQFLLLLPTAVSPAIRRFVIEEIDGVACREPFLGNLAADYAKHFSELPLLGGGMGADIEFRRANSGLLAGVTQAVDRGRVMNLVFVLDDLKGFESGGLASLPPDANAVAKDIDVWIDHASERARKSPSFVAGISLVVGCGIGRGIMNYINVSRPDWRVVMISAPDLQTLSWTPDFKPLTLWRLLDAQDRIEELGLGLHNINGLLNLVAWMRSLDGHLVPHGDLPDDFMREGMPSFLMVQQDLLRDLRQEVAREHDPHAVLDPRGVWRRVSKEGQSLFTEDRAHPLYVTDDFGPEGPSGVFFTPTRGWWCNVELPDDAPGALATDYWRMVAIWLCKAAPVLEQALQGLPDAPLQLTVRFEEAVQEREVDFERLTYEQARAEFRPIVNAASRTLTLDVGSLFDRASFHPDNIAERALVDAVVEGFAELAGHALTANDRAELVGQIMPSPLARHRHAFYTTRFRDFVRQSIPRSPIALDEIDDALLKLGLGWRARDRALGPNLNGKDECKAFMSVLVETAENELLEELKQFDRVAIIGMLLRNHEAAATEQLHWHRTSAAVLALHDDKEAALEVIGHHDSKMSAVFQTTRLLLEMAICQCPLDGGRPPGVLDLARLMAKMGMIFHYGGWSDAIHWEVMEPSLRITPLGDVHGKLNYIAEVFEPFARASSDVRTKDATERYAENFEEVQVTPSAEPAFDPTFLAALKEEFGVSLDEIRLFADSVEDIAITAGRAVIGVPRSALLDVKVQAISLPREAVERLVDYLTFKPRPSWRDVPPGYEARDRHPWRFRRRLSVLRRPLIQIDEADDPRMLIAPGLVRDALMYSLSNYHRGDFPQWQLKPLMKRWQGRTADQRGTKFAQEVAAWFREQGWQAEVEVKITKLLQQGQDRDYGDVDVLAWHKGEDRILAIECKDVQYRKTYGEIAEQLADFRGEVRSNGKRDYLLLHLDRMELISEKFDRVKSYLGMPSATKVESHLMFKNPVPMTFALERLKERVKVSVFRSIGDI
ncbi:hypothetical protein ACIQTU_10220 [Brevundimonas sp. NPDC090276]|uniref:hypothetical protein n=1 Tax=Brevundimonas sp. NPDC090276 TaxID=3363956 RepID=UPI00383B4430